jgi:hypothetical protein
MRINVGFTMLALFFVATLAVSASEGSELVLPDLDGSEDVVPELDVSESSISQLEAPQTVEVLFPSCDVVEQRDGSVCSPISFLSQHSLPLHYRLTHGKEQSPDCDNGRVCVACNFQEPTGPQGSRSYCIDKFYGFPCSELKRRYYPEIPADDLWGFHGTNNAAAVEFMNRGKDPTYTRSPDLFNEFNKQSVSADEYLDHVEDHIDLSNPGTLDEDNFLDLLGVPDSS